MNNRIKEIRNYFGLSQAEFGKRIGVSRDTIANMELNRIEIKDIHMKSICKEFNIDYIWLTTGQNNMFVKDICINSEEECIEAILDNTNKITQNLLVAAKEKYTDKEWMKILNCLKENTELLREVTRTQHKK